VPVRVGVMDVPEVRIAVVMIVPRGSRLLVDVRSSVPMLVCMAMAVIAAAAAG
jgi:hypothetical protein